MSNNLEFSAFYNADAKTIEELDSSFLNLLSDFKVNEWIIPSIIDGETLDRCGYFSTMPNQLSKVGVISKRSLDIAAHGRLNPLDIEFDDSVNMYLTPAACIHFYPMLEGKLMKNEVITTRAQVYRYENGNFVSGKRQWEFTVREMVAVGTKEFVEQFLITMQYRLNALAKDMLGSVEVKVASDHFYPTRMNVLKERFQKHNNLKKELIVRCDDKELAIASFNLHNDHFSKEFHFDQNGTIVSACVGCGIERWLYAMAEKGLR